MVLTKLGASKRVAIVISSQMATKMLGTNGESANFDTADRAVMVPQLGTAYLPADKSYQIVFIPDGIRSGYVMLGP